MKRVATAVSKVLKNEGAPEPMIALTDLLGETALKFMAARPDVEPGSYLIEVCRDGPLLSVRASAEPWDSGEGEVTPPTPEVLAQMYEQIVPSARAYVAECGSPPPLEEGLYDLFAAAGFDLSMVERVSGPRVLQ